MVRLTKTIICVLIMTIFMGMASPSKVDLVPQLGNTIGNILNFGTVVQYKNYIYYQKYSFNHSDIGIYRMKLDGSGIKKVVHADVPMNLNIFNDVIYYTDMKNKILRVGINGKGEKLLYSAGECTNLYVTNGMIYFCDFGKDNTTYIGKLYRMNTDGKDIKIIRNDIRGNLFIYNNRIYYNPMLKNTDGSNRAGNLISTDLNGNNRKDLTIFCYFCILSDKKLYFSDVNDDGSIYVSNLDGTKKKKVTSGKPDCFNVLNDYLYFCMDETLYKIKIDGTRKTELAYDINPEYISIAGDWLFYSQELDIYRINTSGKKQIKI